MDQESAATAPALEKSLEQSSTPDASTEASNSTTAAGSPGNNDDSEPVYPTGTKLILLLASIYLSIFLVALDRTIIATALPRITDHFKSFDDVGWYNAGFLLPMTALQLFFGRLYTFYSPKWIFLALVFTFEVGSALCGAAPNSIAFIWGRAIAGLGAGGLFNGAMILLMYAAPLAKRPFYLGMLGAVFGVASVAGPLLGGVFTTKVSWRWCFYVNLPIGAAVLTFLYFVVEETTPALGHLPTKEKISRLDIPGTLVFVPCIVCLLLALQWGGQQYAWSNGRVIALLVLFVVLLIVFIVIQLWRQESATVPPRIARQRTIAFGALYTFCLASSFLLVVYYLSVWFQAIKGDSAIRSGFSTLPFIMSLVIASILSGIVVSKIGYYNPPILLGCTFTPIAAGLLTLFTPRTAHPMWIGVQVLFGFGVGLGLQQGNIAAQTVLSKADAPTGISMVFFGQGLGGTICVAIGQNVLDNQLSKQLNKMGIDGQAVVNAGATELRNILGPDQLHEALQVYNGAIRLVFFCALAFACASLFAGLGMEWKSVKAAKAKGADPEKQQPEQQKQEQKEDESTKEKEQEKDSEEKVGE